MGPPALPQGDSDEKTGGVEEGVPGRTAQARTGRTRNPSECDVS